MKNRRLPHQAVLIAAALCVVRLCSAAASPPARLPESRPEEAGLDSRKLLAIDPAVDAALREKQMPGCVVLLLRHGKIVFQKAYGSRRVKPEPAAMTVDTVFDLASLTKPVATATSIMILVERGKIGLEDPVARHIPEFAGNGKGQVTVQQLLTHQSGLVPDNSLSDFQAGPQRTWQRIFALTPTAPPGSKFIYSDVGFLVLGELVRRVSGKGLDDFSRENIFRPLGMSETGFLPGAELRRRAAPTEMRDGRWIQGEVHDPRAYALGGIAGHAGLFSTARELAVYSQMLLDRGQYAGARVLQPGTVATMTQACRVPGGLRGLGWDVRSGYSSNRPTAFSARAFGHGGFTGTSLWIDPELDLAVIFLSNRLHPDGNGSVNRLAARIGTLAAEAITDRKTSVLTGIDVLVRDGFRPLSGRKVGLITNHTGVDCRGTSTAQLLHGASALKLVAIFSPEHGLKGRLDRENIADSRDPETGIVVYSLYGKTRRPSPEMLRGIDTLVFDIQDIGTRFYTYISTMGYCMQAAAEHKLRFVVLDRPNPINGRDVAGPVLDPGRQSFVGFHRLPAHHGMTVGELASMFNGELRMNIDLHVVRVEGWRRESYFDATGLAWVNPSPNMRNLNEAILYPGIGLLETTNLSVGRGTATPFELFGAPWLNGQKLAANLNGAGIAGVRFEGAEFTPQSSKFEKQKCSGIRITITDRNLLEPVRVGIVIASLLRRDYRETWDAKSFGRLLGYGKALDELLDGKGAKEIESTWSAGLRDFQDRRARFLLYP